MSAKQPFWIFLSVLLVFSGCSTHHPTNTVPSAATAPPQATNALKLSLSQHRIGPPQLYPDVDLTPGLYDTVSVKDLTKRYTQGCPQGKESCTYSQSHRHVTAEAHEAAYDNYHVTPDQRHIQYGEVDHFYPLCAGGSNEIANLWYQPAENEWKGKNFGYHEKDGLESWICIQIKAKKLDPKEAFTRITQDWVKYYLDEHIGDPQEGEDEDID
jgi:hypothetical protein